MVALIVGSGKKSSKKSVSSDSSTISVKSVTRILESLKSKSNRPSTMDNYLEVWRLFNKFLIRLDFMPDTWEARLGLYVTHMIDKGLQSSTVKSYISAIKFVLQLDDYQWNLNKALFTTLTRACRLENDHVKIRLPIQKSLLEIVLFETERYFKHRNQAYLELVYKTAFILGYYGMLRIGEIASGTHAVKAKDIHVNHDKTNLIIFLYSSKTHGRESRPQKIKITKLNTYERDLKFKSEKGKKFFCPCETIQDYLRLRGDYHTINEPLLIFRDHVPVKPSNIRSVLRKMLRNLNLNDKCYNTHSLRIGRATDLMKQGYTVEQIKQKGRWKSNAVYKYLKL